MSPGKIPSWRPRRMQGRPTKEIAHYQTADWKARRMRILIRDSFRCSECSLVVQGRSAHVDHRIPLEDGGTDDDRNLRVMCERCHGRKTRGEQIAKGLTGL